jgi:hypothetical protein
MDTLEDLVKAKREAGWGGSFIAESLGTADSI